jgi:type IV pilus assembly protein PilC
MPKFEYTARNAQNQLLKGTIEAPNKDEAAKQIKSKKLIMVSLNEPPKGIKLSFGGGGVPTRDVVIFTRQFSTMINAGLPLVQSLTVLAEPARQPYGISAECVDDQGARFYLGEF